MELENKDTFKIQFQAAINSNKISQYELDWIFSKKPLIHNEKQLIIDYGEEETKLILKSFQGEGLSQYLDCLQWPGVGSRWQQFLLWIIENGELLQNDTPQQVFEKFANFLGRIISFRALALTQDQYNILCKNNSIWPTGRLKTTQKNLENIIKEQGVKKVCYARLYIGRRYLQFDPSLSLHDDGETAVCIAQGYASQEKIIHLMQMSVPKIETVGYKVFQIQDEKSQPWFQHNDIWFDAREERTERYCFYEIPFYQERLVKLRVFQFPEEIKFYLQKFQKIQQLKKTQDEQASFTTNQQQYVAQQFYQNLKNNNNFIDKSQLKPNQFYILFEDLGNYVEAHNYNLNNFKQVFDQIYENLINQYDNWNIHFDTLNNLRSINKYYVQQTPQMLEIFNHFICESVNNLRTVIQKTAIIFVKEVFENYQLSLQIDQRTIELLIPQIIEKSLSGKNFIQLESLAAFEQLSHWGTNFKIIEQICYTTFDKNALVQEQASKLLKKIFKNIFLEVLQTFTKNQFEILLRCLAEMLRGKRQVIKQNAIKVCSKIQEIMGKQKFDKQIKTLLTDQEQKLFNQCLNQQKKKIKENIPPISQFVRQQKQKFQKQQQQQQQQNIEIEIQQKLPQKQQQIQINPYDNKEKILYEDDEI